MNESMDRPVQEGNRDTLCEVIDCKLFLEDKVEIVLVTQKHIRDPTLTVYARLEHQTWRKTFINKSKWGYFDPLQVFSVQRMQKAGDLLRFYIRSKYNLIVVTLDPVGVLKIRSFLTTSLMTKTY